MNSGNWELYKQQGSREIWQRTSSKPGGEKETEYRGEEFTELQGEPRKVEETVSFKTESAALAWLHAVPS